MGGGGGGGYFKSDPRKVIEDVKAAQEKNRNVQYEIETNSLLRSYLSEANDRDTEVVGRHLDEIAKALEKEIKGTVDLRFGGSVAKHTYVDGLSDVDSLVLLDNCELADSSPDHVRHYFAERLSERFPNTEITEGTLAVTVKFADTEVQLLPAISCRNNVKIASEDGRSWSEINPQTFAVALKQVNGEVAGKAIPTVKLAKAIIAELPEPQRVSGYHAESLAIEVFKGYRGSTEAKELLKHFFLSAARRVLEPIADRTGQSLHVDDYLGQGGSLERRIVSDALARVARRMGNADANESVAEWRRLFGE